MKTQQIRLIDVFFIGPLLIYVGYKYNLPGYIKGLLIIIGVLTILYNGANYIENENNWKSI